jgi:hypothetical protein
MTDVIHVTGLGVLRFRAFPTSPQRWAVRSHPEPEGIAKYLSIGKVCRCPPNIIRYLVNRNLFVGDYTAMKADSALSSIPVDMWPGCRAAAAKRFACRRSRQALNRAAESCRCRLNRIRRSYTG